MKSAATLALAPGLLVSQNLENRMLSHILPARSILTGMPLTTGGGSRGQLGPSLFQSVVSEQENVKSRSFLHGPALPVREVHKNWTHTEWGFTPFPTAQGTNQGGSHSGKHGDGRERSRWVRKKVSKMEGESQERCQRQQPVK